MIFFKEVIYKHYCLITYAKLFFRKDMEKMSDRFLGNLNCWRFCFQYHTGRIIVAQNISVISVSNFPFLRKYAYIPSHILFQRDFRQAFPAMVERVLNELLIYPWGKSYI